MKRKLSALPAPWGACRLGVGILALSPLLASLSGCAVDERKEVAQYRRILKNDHAVSYTPGEGLPLQTALLLANQNNEQLALSGETYIQALVEKDRATANFLPTITLAPFYDAAERAGGTGGGSVSTFATGGINGVGGNINVPSNGSGSLSGNNISNVSSGVSGSGSLSTVAGSTGTPIASATGGAATPALARPTNARPNAPTLAHRATSSGTVGTTIFGKKNALDVPLQGRYQVFNGFRDVAYYNFTISEIERNRALLLDLQMQVMLDTANAYYAVLSNERSVSVLRANVETQAENVRLIRGQQAAGVAKPSDVAQAEAQAAQTRASLVTAESNVRNARVLLAYLTAAPVNDAPLTDQMGLPDQLPTAEQMVLLGESQRQDLVASRALVESARQAVQVAFGEYYPSITLSVNYYLSKQTIPTNNNWNLVLDAVQPIFDAGLIRADVRTALSQLRQAKLNESLTRRQVDEQVLTAYENLQANGARLKELAIAVDAAREALRVARGLYQFGNGLFLDVLIAQDQLLSAELSLASEEFNRRTFYLSLLREIGRLGPPPGDLITTAPSTQTITPMINPMTLPGVNTSAPPLPATTLPDTTLPAMNPTPPTTGALPEMPLTQPVVQPSTAPTTVP